MDSYDNVAEKRALVSCCCWEELPNGPLLEIALRLSNFEDFMILHLVCTRWNSVLRSSRCKFGDYHQAACCAPQVPWLMMVQRKAFQIDEQLRALPLFFYTLSFRKVHGLPVTFPPQLQHDDFNECCLHSSHGWLLVTNKGTGCCTMSLYNPFSSSTNNYIPLPGFDTFARPSRFALSASPCTTSYTVMITRHDGNVAFWRPGGKGWTIVGPQHTVNLSDVTFYRGHYYALNWLGSLCRICKRKNLAGEEYWFWNQLCGLLPRNTDNKFIWKAYFVVLEEQLLVAIRVVIRHSLLRCHKKLLVTMDASLIASTSLMIATVNVSLERMGAAQTWGFIIWQMVALSVIFRESHSTIFLPCCGSSLVVRVFDSLIVSVLFISSFGTWLSSMLNYYY